MAHVAYYVPSVSSKYDDFSSNLYIAFRQNVYRISHCIPNFDVLLTVHLSIILVINQLNAQILVL